MYVRLLLAALAGAVTLSCGNDSTPPPAAAAGATVVHAVRAEKTNVYAWVYGQGTATAVRRKALYFQLEGKVSYVARGPGGRELRPGDRVEGPKDEELLGQLIAKVDDRDVLANVEASRAELRRTQTDRFSAEAQVKSAEAELEAALRDLKTAQELRASGAGNQADVDVQDTRVKTARASVKNAKSQLGSARSGSRAQAAQVRRSEVAQEKAGIFAPFSGLISAINVKEGDYYFGAQISSDAGQQLRTAPVVLIDPSQFEIKVDLPEYEASKIEVGMPAFILTGEDIASLSQARDPAARPEALLTRGSVFAVSPSVDPSARSIQVTVRVSERSDRLRDGEFASCYIQTEKATNVVSIPYEAFIREDDMAFAFVVPEAGGDAQRREIEVGLTGVSHIEVKNGINAGEFVVTRGRRSLGDGSQVEVAELEHAPIDGDPDEIRQDPKEAG